LREYDAITYCYVKAKIGLPVAQQEAREIFDGHSTDKRVGLLLWSFGQLGLWPVLKEIADCVEELQELKFSSARRQQ